MTLVTLSYIAGVITLINPCAFPLLLIFLASTWQRQRTAPLALLLGFALVFTFMGFSLTSSHMFFEFEVKRLRLISAFILLGSGFALSFKVMQSYFLKHSKDMIYKIRHRLYPTPIKQDILLERMILNFIVGALLGFIWLPFTVPTLSFALTIAHRGDYWGQSSILMSTYTLGVITPLILLSLISTKYLNKSLFKKGHTGLKWLSFSLILVGILVLAGCDAAIETWAIAHTPQWLLNLTTKY